MIIVLRELYNPNTLKTNLQIRCNIYKQIKFKSTALIEGDWWYSFEPWLLLATWIRYELGAFLSLTYLYFCVVVIILPPLFSTWTSICLAHWEVFWFHLVEPSMTSFTYWVNLCHFSSAPNNESDRWQLWMQMQTQALKWSQGDYLEWMN